MISRNSFQFSVLRSILTLLCSCGGQRLTLFCIRVILTLCAGCDWRAWGLELFTVFDSIPKFLQFTNPVPFVNGNKQLTIGSLWWKLTYWQATSTPQMWLCPYRVLAQVAVSMSLLRKHEHKENTTQLEVHLGTYSLTCLQEYTRSKKVQVSDPSWGHFCRRIFL